ncbi:MAG: hypothetical protein LC637_08755 [Xanthomonadaceae bacterium]|nr:hypothetical protein [Xanthomonadaceae bacterium]
MTESSSSPTLHCTPGTWPDRHPQRFASAIIGTQGIAETLQQHREGQLIGAGHGFRGVGLLGLADDQGVRLNGGRVGHRRAQSGLRVRRQSGRTGHDFRRVGLNLCTLWVAPNRRAS